MIKRPLTLLIVIVGLMLTMTSWAQQHVTILSDGWQCRSTASTDSRWYQACVPSTVMGVLTANGEYPDVLTGMNYRKIDKSRFDVPWIYQKSFDLENLQSDEHVTLRFEGISYSANIWLNDRLVAGRETVKGPFRIFEFDVTAFAKEHNTLKVEVFRAQPGDPNIGFVDWNPRPADENMGLFRPVSIKRSGAVIISHPNVKSFVNLQTMDEAWLTVEADVENLSDSKFSGMLTGELEGTTFSVPCTLKAHEKRTLRIDSKDAPVLHVMHPRLWWCHTLGSPELYSMHLQAATGNAVSDETTIRFGIRQVGSFITRDGYRAFTLNGQRILLTGAGWTDDIYNYKTHEVHAVNSTLADADAKAVLKVYDADGQLLCTQDTMLHIAANSFADVRQLNSIASHSSPNTFLFLELLSPDGTLLADNVYALSTDTDVFDWTKSDWTGTPMLHHADHKAIVSGSTTECLIKEKHYYENGRTTVRLEVSNPTDRVAYFLHLSLRTSKGKLIDGVRFSDNYITLEPHGSRTVTCEFQGQQKFKAVVTKE